jgi:hypothetical protein
MKENKEPSKGTVGRPPFVPTDEDRAVVKLLVACRMAHDRVCLRVRGNDGKPISEATLKRHFAHELMVGKVEVETIVLTQLMAAIKRGERWAICKYMDQQSGGRRVADGGRGRMRLLLAVLSRRLLEAICLRYNSLFNSLNPIPRCGQCCPDEVPCLPIWHGQ